MKKEKLKKALDSAVLAAEATDAASASRPAWLDPPSGTRDFEPARDQRQPTGRDLEFSWFLRVVETSVWASDDRECSGKPRDLCESFALSIVQIGDWKR